MPIGAFKLNTIARLLSVPKPTFNTLSAQGGTVEDVFDNGIWWKLHTFKGRDPSSVTAVGNAQVSTAQNQFGGSSALFDGTGDYLAVDNTSSGFTFGTGNFTIEFWVRFTALPTSTDLVILWDQRPSGSQGLQPTIYINSSGTLFYYTNVANRITSSSNLVINTWYHVSVSRSSTSTRMFINGTQTGSTFTDSTNYTSSTNVFIGADQFNTGSSSLNGHIDEVRVSNSARYTANFTTPAAQFVNDTDTRFLCHFIGTNGDTTTIVDDVTSGTSDNTFTVSNLGSSNGVVEVFVLAGGAGGGAHDGLFRSPGGGGAGGLRSTKALVIAGRTFPIQVGYGGRGGQGREKGTNGSNSFATSIITVGGGGGGQYFDTTGSTGGSGGGASTFEGAVNTPGSGISGQGFAGGTNLGVNGAGGGGGGAGAVGGNAVDGVTGGPGGVGVTSTFSGSSIGYAGGGGGAGFSSTQNGTTGGTASFGGGAGSAYARASNGTPHRGAGGGGGNGLGYGKPSGGDGSSGIVMIRYPFNSAANLTNPTLEAVAVVASNTSTLSTIVIPNAPASAINDYAILFDYSTTTTLVVPSGWTQITSSTTTGIRATVSYKKLVSGDIGATITGMTGTTRKVLLICRGNALINTITLSTPVTQATSVTPTNQTLNMTVPGTPVIGFAHYTSNGSVTTRGSTARAQVTTEYTSSASQYVKTFVYNSNYWSAESATISQTDDGINALQSFYIKFNA